MTDGRNVAIRLLPAAMLAGPEVLRPLVAECKAASQISHPNLVKVLDSGIEEGHTFLVLEYVDGSSLYQEIGSGAPRTTRWVVDVATQIVQALDYLHAKEIVSLLSCWPVVVYFTLPLGE